MVEDETREQERVIEEIVKPKPYSPPLVPSPLVYDINMLPHDPSESLHIQSYTVNDQDWERRLFQPTARLQWPKAIPNP